MDENKVLRDSIAKSQKDREIQNAERIDSKLPRAKVHIDNPYTIDNSIEGAVLIKGGIRRNIYQKGNIFFLGDANGTLDKLYAPTKNRAEIENLFEEANSDNDI